MIYLDSLIEKSGIELTTNKLKFKILYSLGYQTSLNYFKCNFKQFKIKN